MTMTKDIHFETVERKIYPRTFLNTVFVVWEYESSYEPDDLILRIQRFLKDNFNLQIGLSEEDFSTGFSIDSQRAGHSYYFTRGSIGVKYMGDNYVSFTETMMPLVYRLAAFVKSVLSIDTINKIQVRKVNILNAKGRDGILFDENQLIQEFLSQQLIANAQPISTEYLGLEKVKEYSGTTEGDGFDIHFGFQKGTSPEGVPFIGLVLDESVSRSQVELNTVDDALISINNMVYNIFHWSVNSNVIALMNQQL